MAVAAGGGCWWQTEYKKKLQIPIERKKFLLKNYFK